MRANSVLCRAAAVGVALLVACTDTRSPIQIAPSDPHAAKKVEASASDVVLMVRTPSAPAGERGGTTRQIDAGIFSKKGKSFPNKNEKFYEWRTTDADVATVDSTGLVSAIGVGRASIIVDYKKAADTVSVEVIPVPVASVRIVGPDSASVDDTLSYAATPLDSAGEALIGRSVAWASSNPQSLTVDDAGTAIALAPGTAFISATCEGKSASVTTKVWIQPVASIDVAPAHPVVALYRSVALTATPRDRRGKVLTGRVLTWRTSDPAIFTIDGASGVVATNAPGAANAIAESEGKQGITNVTVTNPVEARALWVNRFDYSTAASIHTVMQKAASAHFNIVYFQVRTAGDALYYSTIEPCSPRLCGTLGGGKPNIVPPYDPLAIAVADGAALGIEVHAWLNSYTGWIAGSSFGCNQLIESTPRHMMLEHPDWSMRTSDGKVMPCLTSSEYVWESPGVPGVRTRLARVAADIARRYDVRGIHLDRIRYPGTAVSYDAASVSTYAAMYGAPPTASSPGWADLRRSFVNAGVHEVYDSIRAVRPSLVLSAAVWPIYRTPPGWSTGTSKGYDDYFQDTRAWTAGGYLDVAAPMTYPASATSSSYVIKPTYCAFLDWTCLLDDHRTVIEGRDHRQVYIGIGAVKGWSELSAQLAVARGRGVNGMSIYNFSQLDAIPGVWSTLATGYFKYPATIPAMSWK